MSMVQNSPSAEGLESLLQRQAAQLVKELENGDIGAALNVINDLQHAKHQAFYNEVGHLTRGLHEAINSFSNDMETDGRLDSTSISGMTDASERLNYVIEITEKTSHETMDRVDASLVLADKLDSQSTRFKDLLSLVGQLEGEFDGLRGVYDRTCQVKQESEDTIKELKAELTEILVAQSSQDISGQLIRRVITLLTQVQDALVNLIEMAAKIEHLTDIDLVGTKPIKAEEKDQSPQSVKSEPGQVKAEGPQINADKDSSVVSGQDDVDDLLSSLGF
ncbi:MAG: protein phosphatase CheZ [Pseudomonadales bacterium]